MKCNSYSWRHNTQKGLFFQFHIFYHLTTADLQMHWSNNICSLTESILPSAKEFFYGPSSEVCMDVFMQLQGGYTLYYFLPWHTTTFFFFSHKILQEINWLPKPFPQTISKSYLITNSKSSFYLLLQRLFSSWPSLGMCKRRRTGIFW